MTENLACWWERIEEKRKCYGITQKRFCLNLGITNSYYIKLRAGKKNLTDMMKDKMELMLERLNPNNALSMLIDYMRIRFPVSEEVSIYTIAEKVLGIPLENFEILSHGWNNYKTCYAYGEILLACSHEEELGVLLEMRGNGCRQFELYLEYREQEWLDFFEIVSLYDGVYRRVDFAINDHYGMLDISHLVKRCENGECISLNKKFSVCSSGELRFEKFDMGTTLYVGKRTSEIYFCIYEKDYEQYEKRGIPIEEATTKNRFEMRLAKERAIECISNLLATRYEENFMEEVVFGVINNYIRFAVRDELKRKVKWENDVMWEHFIGGYRNKLRLAMRPQPFDERRSKNWLSHQCVPTLKGFIMRDIKRGTTEMIDMINRARATTKLVKILELEEAVMQEMQCRMNKKGELEYVKKEEINKAAC